MYRIGSRARRLARLFALGLCVTGGAAVAEVRTGEDVVIREGEVIPEDLYVFATNVVVAGQVHGDLVAFASSLDVQGRVDGDVIVVARDTKLSGPIGGSVRAAANTLWVTGPVGKDVLAAASEIGLGRHAMIGRDLIVAGGNVQVGSEVGRDVRAATGKLWLNSVVHGDARVRAKELLVGEDSVIGGTLSYGAKKANISRAARIGNEQQIQQLPRARGRGTAAWFVIGWLRWSVGLFALGLIVRVLFPRFTRTVPETLRHAPWESLGIGAAVLFGVPVAALLLFVIGAVIGGWWIGLIALGMLAAAILLCFPMVGLFIGDWLTSHLARRHVRLVVSLVIGVVLLALVVRIPILGALIALATILFGLGALTVSGWRLRPVLGSPGGSRQVE